MILKLIGMAMVFVSSSLIGFGFAECMASRERELANLEDAMEMMLSEISYSAMPVRDIIATVTPRVNGMAGEMLDYMCSLMDKGESVSSAWEAALESKAAGMSLKKSDADIITKSAYLLEGYELEEQKLSIVRMRDRLSELSREAGEEKKKNGRIVKMLGIYGGMLLCIMIF